MERLRSLIKNSGRKKTWIAEQLNMPYSSLNAYLFETRTAPHDLEKRIKKLL